jgi:ABC-type hemin transport system substrate-binding protein
VRVVSLVPSLTETLLAWNVDVVACTRFCEQPQLRHVGGTKDPDRMAIVALAPDLVVMDREENGRDDAEALAAAGIRLHVTCVRSVADVDEQLAALAVVLGVAVPPRVDPVPIELVAAGRSVFVPIWRRPWMTLSDDTYGASLLAAIGCVNVFAGADDRYPTVVLDEVAELAPRLVLLPSEPYPFTARHVAEVAAALPDAEVVLVDGRDLFWWGVRTPAALERLRAQLAGRGRGSGSP